jgi:hypothetical protein
METYSPYGFGDHTAKVTFQWDRYKLTKEVLVGGNCKGFSIIESAVDEAVDKLYEKFGEEDETFISLDMVADDDSTCECEFEDDDELKDAVVAVELTGWEQEKAEKNREG